MSDCLVAINSSSGSFNSFDCILSFIQEADTLVLLVCLWH